MRDTQTYTKQERKAEKEIDQFLRRLNQTPILPPQNILEELRNTIST